MQTETQFHPYGYIYKITNSINNKCYIGQTVLLLEERWTSYKNLNCKKQPKIYNALKKYGPEAFMYEQLDTAPDQIVLDYLEDFYIQCLDSIKNGYNCKEGGAHGKHSRETKQKISNSCKGRIVSSETLLKMSKASKGNKNNTGRKFSTEHRQKMSNARKGFKPSAASVEKSAAGHRGIKYSSEIRQKLSDSHKGSKHTEETKRKIGYAIKAIREQKRLNNLTLTIN